MNVVSLFSGCGGLDLGFEKAGFNIIWANEFDKSISETYIKNHSRTILNTTDIRFLKENEIPNCDGIIGGPPCQSWSEGGKRLGIADSRGKLFLEYIRIVSQKKPKFFVVENVKGILDVKHKKALYYFINSFSAIGYNVYCKLLNAADYGVPQDRYRVFFVGISKEIHDTYYFPNESCSNHITLQQAIGDIKEEPSFYKENEVVKINTLRPNHDVYCGAYDAKYMARNRVRSWDEVSFTMQAQARNAPQHPQAPKMTFLSPEKREFVNGAEHLYRRLSVRECARIQSFPDSFVFDYSNICVGYKMVGNAVPPRLSYVIAKSIKDFFASVDDKAQNILVGYYKGDKHLKTIISQKLYYIRSTNNKMQCNNLKYLLLHYKNTYHLFSLKKDCHLISSAELRAKGFSPTFNGNYLAFDISEEVDIKNIESHLDEIKKKASNNYSPFVF